MLVIAAAIVGMALIPTQDTAAHTVGFPTVRYNPFRLPWGAESSWAVWPGNPPDPDPPDPNNTHFGWQVDFSSVPGGGSNYGEPVKSIGGGTVTYYNDGADVNYGLHAIVVHAGQWWSRYAHLCATGAPAGAVVQGTWLGDVGNTGEVDPAPAQRCQSIDGAHLHFEVGDPSGTLDATLTGVSITHLGIEERFTPHKSDNAGAGYTDPRTRDEAFHARAVMPDASPASTRKGKFTTCGAAETHYLYTCPYYAFTVRGQDFVGPRLTQGGLQGLHETFSLVQTTGPTVVKVKGAIQKAYQSRVVANGARVSSYLGRPLGEEGLLSGHPFQNFENGTIIVLEEISWSPPRRLVRVIAGDGSTLLERTLTNYAGAGDCASVNGDPHVNIIDVQQVAVHAANDGEPGYDRLYDFWGGNGTAGYSDGAINVLDLFALSARYGLCPAEL